MTSRKEAHGLNWNALITAGVINLGLNPRHSAFLLENSVMAKNTCTFGKYDQRGLWKLICIVNPFDLLFKKSQKSNLSLDNKNLKWGETTLWNKCFSQIHIGHN